MNARSVSFKAILKTVPAIVSHWNSRNLAWGVAAVDVLAAAACALLYALNRGDVLSLSSTLAFGLLPLAGAVIIARQPRNAVGWLPAIIGSIFVVGDLLTQYSVYVLITHPGVLPFGGTAIWIGSWSWMLVYPLVVVFLLLIPDGRLISRRWLVLVWAGVVTTLPTVLYYMTFTASIEKIALLKSQIYNTSLDVPGALLFWRVFQIWQPLQFLLILLASVGLYVRFSRSKGIERQQLKWFFFPIITIPVAVGLGFLTGNDNNPLLNDAYQVINLLSAISFPMALAFAVTRYRLYDIDIIIRRTLVYSSLTIILASVYLGSVILLQGLFTLLTGQHSTATIVISTLVIAALFSPLRQRVQTWIDWRFFRAKYNTEQMLERFASRQRESVDLEDYSSQLLGVVDEILHPESVSLFLVNTPEIRQKPFLKT